MAAAPTDAAAWADVRFRAMGTHGRILVHGGPRDLAARATARIEDLEARWSRFRADSELSRLNRSGGSPVAVSRPTFDLVSAAVQAWHLTGGRFDPTVHDALLAAGYDRDFDDLAAGFDDERADDGPSRPAPGAAHIELDRVVGAVRLPAGTRLDLGGIGKGSAVDTVTTDLLDAGASGVCIDLGGDLRCEGDGPLAGAWEVQVDRDLAPGVTLFLRGGAVCTSSRMRRAWVRNGRPVHHLIDPKTGEPAATGLRAVTVVAATAGWAEVLAKASFVAGPVAAREMLADACVTGLLTHDDGRIESLPGLDRFLERPA